MVEEREEGACSEAWVEVNSAELPLSCPGRHQRCQMAHPRVYLPLERTGKEKCYYCGTVYVLKDFKAS